MNKIFRKPKHKQAQKGSIILLVVLVLAGILIVSLGASTIISRGLKTGRTQSDSTVAYFAAETGIERYMEEYYKEGTNPGADGILYNEIELSNEAKYTLEYERDGEENVLKAYGYYGDSNRFIEKRFEDPVPPENPVENMALSHTSNNKNFTISWTAGIGNGTCRLQFHQNGSNWIDILSATSLDCDNDLNQSFDLNPDGWKANWDATSVRIVRNSDDQEVGVFTQDLSCSSISASSVSTPSIDEDCNGEWNNFTQVTECNTCHAYECTGCKVDSWYRETATHRNLSITMPQPTSWTGRPYAPHHIPAATIYEKDMVAAGLRAYPECEWNISYMSDYYTDFHGGFGVNCSSPSYLCVTPAEYKALPAHLKNNTSTIIKSTATPGWEDGGIIMQRGSTGWIGTKLGYSNTKYVESCEGSGNVWNKTYKDGGFANIPAWHPWACTECPKIDLGVIQSCPKCGSTVISTSYY